MATQLQQAKVPFDYEALDVDYTIKHKYKPDFILTKTGIIIEAKGYFRPGDVAKMRAVKAQNPDLDVRIVFMDADRRIPGQKQTHGEWAQRHGFPFASGKIPEDWLKE